MVYRNGKVQAVTLGSNVLSGVTSEVESIEIGRPPFQTSYLVGDTFNPDGLIILAHFINGEITYVPLENLSFSYDKLQSINIQHIAISYTYNDKTVTVSLPIKVVNYACFGVMWDYSQKTILNSALTRLTPSSDPNNFVTMSVQEEPISETDTQSGSSPFDDFMPWSGMEEYNIINNKVTYKKGSNVNFSRTAYDTVVYIPTFYYRVIDDPIHSKRYWYVTSTNISGFEKHPGSDRYIGKYSTTSQTESKSGTNIKIGDSLTNYRDMAVSKGNKWYLYDYASHCAVQLLYLIEFSNWDSQSNLGMGMVNASPLTTGATDSISYHTGMHAGHIKYRNIEDPYMWYWTYLDGVIQRNYTPYICVNPKNYSDTITDSYISTNINNPQASSSYIINFGYTVLFPWAFIPSKVGGTSSEVTDISYSTSGENQICFYGGYNGTGKAGGMFAIAFYQNANKTYSYGRSRLMYVA